MELVKWLVPCAALKSKHALIQLSACLLKSGRVPYDQGWKPKLKPTPENPVLKEILETLTKTYLTKFLKT